jgi:hypothetical protein
MGTNFVKISKPTCLVAGTMSWLFLLAAIQGLAQGTGERARSQGPIVISAISTELSTPQSRLLAERNRVEKENFEEEFLGRYLPPGAEPGARSLRENGDSALQKFYSLSIGVMAEPTIVGLGSDFPHYKDGSVPPDTNAAVGTTQIVEVVNTSYAVFDKKTGTALAVHSLASLYSRLGPCGRSGTNLSDPIVKFDQLANRWLIAYLAYKTGLTAAYQCIAVSTTADATKNYVGYVFDVSTLGGLLSAPALNDYDKLGVWPDAYYVSWNEFSSTSGHPFAGVGTCAFDRARMIAGQSANSICFLTSKSEFSLLPSDLDGASGAAGTTALPPPGAPNYYLGSLNGTNAMSVWNFHVDFSTPSQSTFTKTATLSVASYGFPCGGRAGNCVPQPSGAPQLESLGDRLMFRNAYRNFAGQGGHESLVVSHSVAQAGSGNCGLAVRWYEIRSPGTIPTVFQQGTFAPDSNCRWMASVAMDENGDMALGYSVASSGVDPSIYYTGRIPADALGTMEGEASAIIGTGQQQQYRWGDYSSMAIDPSDDCTFWYAQEYMKTTAPGANWSTLLIPFKFPSCSGGAHR